MVKLMTVSLLALAAAVLLVTVAQIPVAEGATCQVTALQPCLAAISSSSPPSALCCTRLRQQQPCFCTYLKNPNVGQYINSPNAKKVSSTCKVSIPKCSKNV